MKGSGGISLIELVAVIVVVGISIPALLTGWADLSWRSAQAESLADASMYGQELMEEVLSRRFDEVTKAPWTDASLFSARRSDETGETGRTLFDDIDDYQGFSETVNGYLRNVTVQYMQLSGTAWQASAAPTDFKRVRVNVSRSGKAGAQITLETLMGAQ